MSLTGYFDQTTTSIDAQIESAKQLDIKGLSFRFFNQKTLLDIDSNDIKDLMSNLKKEKLSIQIIDSMLVYPLVTVNKNDLTLLFQNAENLGTKYLIMSLPTMSSFDLQHDALIDHIKYILDETKKKHFEVIFKMQHDHAVGQIAYLINEVKNVKFVLDPALIFKQGSSVTTSYRILKNNIQIITINDLDKQHEPYLLGLGAVNIGDILKKSKRDKFKGLYLMDNNLLSYIENRKNVYNQKKFLWVFSKNKKDKIKYQKMDAKLNIQETDELSLMDMHKIYVSIIQKVIE